VSALADTTDAKVRFRHSAPLHTLSPIRGGSQETFSKIIVLSEFQPHPFFALKFAIWRGYALTWP